MRAKGQDSSRAESEEQLLTRLIGPVCTAEAITAAKAQGQTLGDYVSEAVSRTGAFLPGCDADTALVTVLFKDGSTECALSVPDWLHRLFCDGVPWYVAGQSERVIIADQTVSAVERAALKMMVVEPISAVPHISDMEEVINEALALLDLFSVRYAKMIVAFGPGKTGGRTSAGAAELERRIAGKLNESFDLAFKEMMEMRHQCAAARLLFGLPLPAGEARDLKEYLRLANIIERYKKPVAKSNGATTPARETAPDASAEGKVAA